MLRKVIYVFSAYSYVILSISCHRVPLRRTGPVVTKPEQLVDLRRRIEWKYSGGAPGDDPEPLTDYQDVSYGVDEVLQNIFLVSLVKLHMKIVRCILSLSFTGFFKRICIKPVKEREYI